MSVTPKRLMAPAQLPAAAASQYTAPANTRTILKKCSFCNTTGTARVVTLYIVPSGGAANAADTLWSAVSVPAGATVEGYDIEGHVLLAGDAVWAFADVATAVTMHLSGMEVV